MSSLHAMRRANGERCALEELVPDGGASETDFWLVDEPFTSLKRGRLVDRAHLTQLVTAR